MSFKVRLGLGVKGWEYADLRHWPHGAVGGGTMMGKSVFVRQLLTDLCLRMSPEQLRVFVTDFKHVEFKRYGELDWFSVATDMDECAAMLVGLWREIKERQDRFVEAGAVDLGEYNERVKPGMRLPYVLFIVDEYAHFAYGAKGDYKQLKDLMAGVFQLGRFAGVHGLICTQRATQDIVDGMIKANCHARISFRVTSAQESKNILDHAGAEKLECEGRLLYAFGSRVLELQAPFISQADSLSLLKARQVKEVRDELAPTRSGTGRAGSGHARPLPSADRPDSSSERLPGLAF